MICKGGDFVEITFIQDKIGQKRALDEGRKISNVKKTNTSLSAIGTGKTENINAKATGYSKNSIETAAKDIAKEFKDRLGYRIRINVDKDAEKIVVRVFDKKSDKLIKQIPPEEIVQVSKKIKEMCGLLFDKEV